MISDFWCLPAGSGYDLRLTPKDISNLYDMGGEYFFL